MRVETNEERRERILSHSMEVHRKAGMETTLTAREINEGNRKRPVVVTSSSDRQEQPRHPLWRDLSLIPSPRSSLGRSLETDKFGFHADIIEDICTKTKHRYYNDTEKVFLTTQVNLMLSLSSKNRNNQLLLVKNMCRRMGIRHPDTPDKTLWTQLSANVRKWSDKFDIHPIWEDTDFPNSVILLDDETRKYLKEDFDLFTSYSFTQRESAELANAIHGTERAGNTISEWAADGTPRDRKDSINGTKKKPVSTTKEEPMHTEVVEKDTKVSSTLEKGFYPTDAKYWVTSKGEKCKDCGNPHCQENLVDMPSVLLKMILAVKDGVLDWRQLLEDDVRKEIASKTEEEANVLGDEAKALRLELGEVERQLASAKNDNQILAKQLEVVNQATAEKERQVRDLLS